MESELDEQVLYIANIPDTGLWMLMVLPEPPVGCNFKKYSVPSGFFEDALEAADSIVGSLQGTSYHHATLPDELIDWM